MNLKSKLFTSAVALTMVLGVAIPASAQTTAELTAQINSLLAMISQLQAQLAAKGGSTTGAAATTFTTNLTVGSKGAEVTALQQWLVAKGFMTAPASYGYFGPATKAALVKYQTSAGITPAAGYFGPLTRAKVNAEGGATTGGTTTVPAGSISTPGVEGTISVTSSSIGLPSTLYVGDQMAGVLGFKVEAKNSDMAVQRIKLDLGTSTTVYTKVFSKVYVTEGGNTLASADLNSSTVTKDGSRYYVTIAGFNSIVPKDGNKIYTIKMDVKGAIDTTYRYADPIRLASNGVRAVDGAGIDQYGGDTTITRTPSIAAALADSASLTVSLNSATPKKNDVICASGTSENECDKLTLLTFDVKAEKDSVKITDMQVAISKGNGSGATASTTVYLYDGSTEVDNATISGDTVTFTNDLTISKDVTKTYTVKADIRGANGTRIPFTASASSTGITAENSAGTSVTTKSGTATGNAIGARNIGPEFTLVSKNITTSGVPQNNNGTTELSTSTITATFNVKVKAVGGALEFGTSQATTSPFVSSSTGFNVYRDGAADATLTSNATSTSITVPSNCTTAGYTNSCQLAEGNEGTFAVSYQLQGRKATGAVFTSGLYSMDIARINWTNLTNGVSNSTFMSGETDWRTSDVSFP